MNISNKTKTLDALKGLGLIALILLGIGLAIFLSLGVWCILLLVGIFKAFN